jgi:hypothetical protein
MLLRFHQLLGETLRLLLPLRQVAQIGAEIVDLGPATRLLKRRQRRLSRGEPRLLHP